MKIIIKIILPVFFLSLAFFAGHRLGIRNCARPWGSPEKRAEFRQHMLDKMSDQLNLTSEQRGKVSLILEERGKQFGALRNELRPKFEEIRQSMHAEIRVLLDNEQQLKFDQFQEKINEKRRKRSETSAPSS